MAGIGSVGLTEMTFVTGQPVLAQLEAVVRRVKDECFLECTCALQQVDHLAQVVVHAEQRLEPHVVGPVNVGGVTCGAGSQHMRVFGGAGPGCGWSMP
jgi:hypothetical protein